MGKGEVTQTEVAGFLKKKTFFLLTYILLTYTRRYASSGGPSV